MPQHKQPHLLTSQSARYVWVLLMQVMSNDTGDRFYNKLLSIKLGNSVEYYIILKGTFERIFCMWI